MAPRNPGMPRAIASGQGLTHRLGGRKAIGGFKGTPPKLVKTKEDPTFMPVIPDDPGRPMPWGTAGRGIEALKPIAGTQRKKPKVGPPAPGGLMRKAKAMTPAQRAKAAGQIVDRRPVKSKFGVTNKPKMPKSPKVGMPKRPGPSLPKPTMKTGLPSKRYR